MAGSGSHYYDDEGKLIDRVPYKDSKRVGETRPTTVTDARELKLNPSVTTFLTVQSKPMVEKWKIEQAILASMTNPWSQYALDQREYVKQIAAKAEEIVEKAADQGTEIHNMVCNMLGGRRYLSPMPFPNSERIAEAVIDWLKMRQYEVLETEHVFVNKELGYAGTIDLKVMTAAYKVKRIDIKTNDFETEKACPFYDEHKMQVCGYHIGDNAGEEDECEILYVSRKVPGLIVPKLVANPSVYKRMFLATAHHWAATHKWKLPAAFYELMMEYES